MGWGLPGPTAEPRARPSQPQGVQDGGLLKAKAGTLDSPRSPRSWPRCRTTAGEGEGRARKGERQVVTEELGRGGCARAARIHPCPGSAPARDPNVRPPSPQAPGGTHSQSGGWR